MKKVIWFSEFLLYENCHAYEIKFDGQYYQECFIMKGGHYRKSNGELYFKVITATLDPLPLVHLRNDRPVLRNKIYSVFYDECEEKEKILSFPTLQLFLGIDEWCVKKSSYFRSHWGTKKVIQILKREFDKLSYETDWKD